MAKRYRDAVTGEFISKEEAMAKTNESVAETVKKRGRGRPRKPVPEPTVVPQDETVVKPDIDLTGTVVVSEDEWNNEIQPKIDVVDEMVKQVEEAESRSKQKFGLDRSWIYKGDRFIPGEDDAKVTDEVKEAIIKKTGE